MLARAHASLANLKVRKINASGDWLISGLPFCLAVRWDRQYANSLDGSSLRAELYDGPPRLPGLVPALEMGHRLKSMEFDYWLLSLGHHGYVERGSERRSFSAEKLADHLLRICIDAAEKFQRH